MGWCINYMKFFLYLCIALMVSSCAVKQKSECISSSLLISRDNNNINLFMQDNGCKYTIHKMPENIWKIEVENGSFSAFTPKAEKDVKKFLPVIKKNNKEILLFFASSGSLTQNKNSSSFTYMQNTFLDIPERKAGYIEEILCSTDKTVIKSNGAVVFNSGSLYNGRKYIDIYNISLKKGYVHNKCSTVSSPVSLRFPKRVRYFLISDNLNLYSDGKNIIISNQKNNNHLFLTDINEEKTLKTQKIKLEFSKNIEIAASNITSGYTTIILKGRYEPLQNIPHSKSLKGTVFKQIDITPKSEVTEIRLYTGSIIKQPFISIDKVDNNIIIYADK